MMPYCLKREWSMGLNASMNQWRRFIERLQRKAWANKCVRKHTRPSTVMKPLNMHLMNQTHIISTQTWRYDRQCKYVLHDSSHIKAYLWQYPWKPFSLRVVQFLPGRPPSPHQRPKVSEVTKPRCALMPHVTPSATHIHIHVRMETCTHKDRRHRSLRYRAMEIT